MIAPRWAKIGLPRSWSGILIVAAVVAPLGPASAQGRLEARYEASLAGIPVGKGTWTIDIADDHFSAQASGGSSGLLNVFASGSGGSASSGRIVAGALSPQAYTVTTTSSRKTETIRMVMAAGTIKDVTIDPESPPDPGRIVVTDAHRRGVLDPMTGTLMRVAGNSDPVSAEACRNNAPIFDGRMRYDLKFEFKRMDAVRPEKIGYRGPVVVCAVTFEPIAGYIPDRASIKYLAAQRNMEVWLAPIAGTRVLVPYRVTVPTPLGTAMLEASHFLSTASPPRAAARTQ